MKIVFDEAAADGAIRADRAWELFFGPKKPLVGGPGMPRFAEWFWDELGRKAGNLNKNSKGEVTVAVPELDPGALDFVLRLASVWADEVYLREGETLSGNLWKAPVANVFDDQALDGAERAQRHDLDDEGSVERNLMPVLGPGRAFYSVQLVEAGSSTARLHSHSALDEYYLVLEGRGTLRFNGKEVGVKPGDLVGKPSGPDAATHIIADRGERMRILDMEIWHQRAHFPKDFVADPDFREVILRGQGWDAVIPVDSLSSSEDSGSHYQEGYRRNKDGGWTPAELRGHKKVRQK